MRPTVLAGLALALASLVAALFVPSSPPAAAPDAGAAPPALLSGVAEQDVRFLTVADGAMRVHFVRGDDGRWSDPDLASVADATLATLLAAPRLRTLVGDEEAPAYGLGALALRVDVGTDDGTTTLRFGDVAPTGDAVYAHDDRDDPGTILLVPRIVRSRLERAIDRPVSR